MPCLSVVVDAAPLREIALESALRFFAISSRNSTVFATTLWLDSPPPFTRVTITGTLGGSCGGVSAFKGRAFP